MTHRNRRFGRGTGVGAWVERELAAAAFPDERLKGRLGPLLADLGARIGGTIPAACPDWAATKTGYRFFDDPRVDDQTNRGAIGHHDPARGDHRPRPGAARHDRVQLHPQHPGRRQLAGVGDG